MPWPAGALGLPGSADFARNPSRFLMNRPAFFPESLPRSGMKNFLRALRRTWPYRRRLVISVVCAVCAAVLWSLNFTAIYPVLKILGNDDSLQEQVDSRIAETERQIAQLNSDIERLTVERESLKILPSNNWLEKKQKELAGSMARLESKLNSAW